jgi:hypothetical protein
MLIVTARRPLAAWMGRRRQTRSCCVQHQRPVSGMPCPRCLVLVVNALHQWLLRRSPSTGVPHRSPPADRKRSPSIETLVRAALGWRAGCVGQGPIAPWRRLRQAAGQSRVARMRRPYTAGPPSSSRTPVPSRRTSVSVARDKRTRGLGRSDRRRIGGRLGWQPSRPLTRPFARRGCADPIRASRVLAERSWRPCVLQPDSYYETTCARAGEATTRWGPGDGGGPLQGWRCPNPAHGEATYQRRQGKSRGIARTGEAVTPDAGGVRAYHRPPGCLAG